MILKYFYIDNIKFNYTLEFDTLDPKNDWKLNAPLIEYFETLGITIPHYCYHKNLSIAGNCRMCLIELKKSPKPVVSCAMTAKSSLATNSEIYTNSPLVKKARENVMEFLLLNHPLDCPICDQGGECDLQDQSLFFGLTKKRFYSFKRVVLNKNIGPIVKTLMTRCIHCTRCVRFATEIAGVENLGIFGRGINSEIGTYVNKIFQSELSGNVIDICPVGALTSKPYPFIGRNWELKTLNSLDVSDGFGLDIQILLKNNKIIKVLPGYNSKDKINNWISDKTRFLFDGMFTPDRKLDKTIISGSNNGITLSYWEQMFKDLVHTIYFYDHLNRHCFKINQIFFVFDDTISLEVLSLLQTISKKFPFFKIRKTNKLAISKDFETDLQVSTATDFDSLNKTNVCLLIGTNPRYEGSYLNLKLKKRMSKGGFKVFTFNNLNNLTFPTISLGNNTKTLKNIVEGKHSICQSIKEAKRVLLVINSSVFERQDVKSITDLMNFLKLNTTIQTDFWNGYNMINNSLNSTGVNLLNHFETFNNNDLKSSNLIYFINTNLSKTKLRKLVDLKLLNYLTTPSIHKCLVEQNSKITPLINNKWRSNLQSYKHFYLPNNVFFETAGSYVNTEGIIKKTIKIVSSKKNTKDDWQLLRKFYAMVKHITFVSNPLCNKTIQFNCKNLLNFKNFTSFLYLNATNLSKLCLYLPNTTNQNFNIKAKNYSLKKSILNNTILKKNINDFYIDGFDLYSKFSFTMINCSNILRSEKTNFK